MLLILSRKPEKPEPEFLSKQVQNLISISEAEGLLSVTLQKRVLRLLKILRQFYFSSVAVLFCKKCGFFFILILDCFE